MFVCVCLNLEVIEVI